MAISSSPTMSEIRTEFGGAAPDSLSEYYKGGAYVTSSDDAPNVPTSGQISMSDFIGASQNVALSVGNSYTASGTGSANITIAGVAGDLVCVWAAQGASANVTWSSTTSGYTKLYDLYASALYDMNAAFFYKRLTGTETTVNVTSSTSAGIYAMATIIKGSNATDPIGAAANVTTTGASFENPPPITLESTDSLVITTFAGTGLSGFLHATPTAPSGWTRQVNNNTTATGGSLATRLVTGGGVSDPGNWNAINVYDGDAGHITTTIEVKG